MGNFMWRLIAYAVAGVIAVTVIAYAFRAKAQPSAVHIAVPVTKTFVVTFTSPTRKKLKRKYGIH